MYFKSWIDKTNMTTYSLDMLRLNIEFPSIETKNKFVEWLRKIDTFRTEDYLVEYFPCFSAFKYRHLWSIKTKNNNSWSIGLDRTGKPQDAVKGFIEFNPNKCMNDDLFVEFWDKLRGWLLSVVLVRYDVAIDIPLPRSQCRLYRVGRKMYELIIQDDGMTEYLGQRSHNGFVKLYDKTIESGLNYELTRLEITLDNKAQLQDVFPVVHIYDTQSQLIFADNLSNTDKTLIQLLRGCEDKQIYLKQLGYRMRKKIEPYIADRVLQFDNKCFQSVRAFATSFCK